MTTSEPTHNANNSKEAVAHTAENENSLQPSNLAASTSAKHHNKDQWPKAFYCTELGKLMSDPVIGPNGDSYERSAVVQDSKESSNSPSYYPNRALKAVIEESLALRDNTWRASVRSIQQTLSHGLVHLLPESTVNEKMFRPLSDVYYCPITFTLMHVPVTDPEGNTFEKVAIENWIRVNGNSPITRATLCKSQLYPNNAIRNLLEEEKQKPIELMHPSVRKWKDEPIPQATDVEFGGAVDAPNPSSSSANVSDPMTATTSQLDTREVPSRRAFCRSLAIMFAIMCVWGYILQGSLAFFALFVSSLIIVACSSRQ